MEFTEFVSRRSDVVAQLQKCKEELKDVNLDVQARIEANNYQIGKLMRENDTLKRSLTRHHWILGVMIKLLK